MEMYSIQIKAASIQETPEHIQAERKKDRNKQPLRKFTKFEFSAFFSKYTIRNANDYSPKLSLQTTHFNFLLAYFFRTLAKWVSGNLLRRWDMQGTYNTQTDMQESKTCRFGNHEESCSKLSKLEIRNIQNIIRGGGTLPWLAAGCVVMSKRQFWWMWVQ